MTKKVSTKRKPVVAPKGQSAKDFLKDIVFVLGAFLVLNSMVLAAFEVPTGSMENEIMAGDFLFVNKFIYGGSTPRTIPLTNIRITTLTIKLPVTRPTPPRKSPKKGSWPPPMRKNQRNSAQGARTKKSKTCSCCRCFRTSLRWNTENTNIVPRYNQPCHPDTAGHSA